MAKISWQRKWLTKNWFCLTVVSLKKYCRYNYCYYKYCHYKYCRIAFIKYCRIAFIKCRQKENNRLQSFIEYAPGQWAVLLTTSVSCVVAFIFSHLKWEINGLAYCWKWCYSKLFTCYLWKLAENKQHQSFSFFSFLRYI